MSLPIGGLAKPQDSSTMLAFWNSYGTKNPQTWPCGHIALTVQLRGSDWLLSPLSLPDFQRFPFRKVPALDLAPFT